jgi:ketosteroid isomerase-like protein
MAGAEGDPSETRVIHAFLDRVGTGDPSVVDFYVEEGAELRAGGKTHHGRDEIQAFYTKAFENRSDTEEPEITLRALLGAPPVVAALLDVRKSDGSAMSVVDVFTLRDGKIASLHAYYDIGALASYRQR